MSENKSDTLNLSATQFFDILSKSQIIPSDKLSSIEKQLKKTGNKIATEKLVESLIKAKLITRWQSEKLLRGRYKGFFLGKYKLLDHLGTGGMSTVYLAQQSLTGQQRAIKVLPRKKLNDRSYLPRFYREARAIAALNHPNIIRIFDVNHQDDTHFMVMEYVQGCDLYDVVTDHGPVGFDLACDCIVQAAEGLAHAHDQNLIHRDIKPANLFRTDGGVVKVLDLGLALLKSDDDEHGLSKQFNESTMGTADYLSPEQAVNSHDVDHRTDIYSLGCTLYFLLTGQPPFNEGTLAQRIAKHQTIMPTDVAVLRSDCPPGLQAICMKMLAKDPDERFADCRSLIAALNAQEYAADDENITINTAAPGERTTKPIGSTTKAKRKKRIPWPTLTSLLLLLAIPIALATYLLTPADNQDQPNPSDNSSVISDSEGQVRDHQELYRQEAATASTQATGKVDFKDLVGFGSSRSQWDLSKFGIEGELKSEGHSQIVQSPNNHSDQYGPQVLRIRGDSREVEFVPYDKKNSKLSGVQFQAMRETQQPTEVVIEAKSTKRSEKWQEIVVLTDQINADSFSEIQISQEVLNKITNPQKFRFKIGGTKGSGIYIDHLKIEFQ